MADGHGGHRTPRNPAPVSGPGRLSKRTDGGPGQKLMAPTGLPYGDHEKLMDQERASAMSQQSAPPKLNIPEAPGTAAAGYSGPGMGEPSQRPDEPVTAGADIGAGPGAEAMPFTPGAAKPSGYITTLLNQLSATDTTGTLGDLYLIAKQRGV